MTPQRSALLGTVRTGALVAAQAHAKTTQGKSATDEEKTAREILLVAGR